MAAKKIVVTLGGIMPIPLKLEVATETETKTHAVCTGGGSHKASRVKMGVSCPECGETKSSVFGFPDRAVAVGDDLVVLTKEQLSQAKGVARTGRAPTPANPDVAGIELKFHTRESVYGNTLPGDSVQNVYPDRNGEKAYALLMDAMLSNLDLVAVMIWAPTNVNALWVLEVADGRIVASKRSWPEQVRKPEEIAPQETTDAERALFAQVVQASATDFEMEAYVNEAAKSLNELVDAATPEAKPGADMEATLHDLLASIDAAMTEGKKPAKKAAKKKVAA